MSKTVQFKMPTPKAESADDWVQDGVEPHLKPVIQPEPQRVAIKRLTLDMPAELHARFKIGCARRQITMLDVICRFIETEFPGQPGNP